VPARNSQSSNKLFGRRPELLGAGKVFSCRIRPCASREDRPKRNPTSSRSSSRHYLSVYLGPGDVGYIYQVGRTYTAKTLDGQSLGVFAEFWSAADAVSVAAPRVQVLDVSCCKANPGIGLVCTSTMPNLARAVSRKLNGRKSGFAASAQKVDC
jgi:hypothetical protein